MPHIRSQNYSLDGELALSGLTNTDFPNGFSSYQYNLLYIPKVSIVKTVEDDKTIDSDLSFRLLRHYSGDYYTMSKNSTGTGFDIMMKPLKRELDCKRLFLGPLNS